MKKVFKYIFLIIITIILFANNKVYAEQSLTCYYKSTGTYRFMFEQDSAGNKSIYRMIRGDLDPEDPVFSDCKNNDCWIKMNYKFSSNDKVNKCPNSINISKPFWIFGSTTVDFKNDESGKYKIYNSSTGSEVKLDKQDQENGVNTNTVFENVNENKCSNNSNYTVCKYGKVNICFNEKNWEFEFPDKTYMTAGYLGINANFKLRDFLNAYKENNECPKVFYDLPTGQDVNLHISLTDVGGKYYQTYTPGETPELNIDLPEITNCSALLGDPAEAGSPAYYLVKAFHVIKYVALVLMIVLSVMDFTTAIAKQDKDVMAKLLKKLMMRFILCIIIFLLPYLIDLLLRYLVERQTDLCGIK